MNRREYFKHAIAVGCAGIGLGPVTPTGKKPDLSGNYGVLYLCKDGKEIPIGTFKKWSMVIHDDK